MAGKVDRLSSSGERASRGVVVICVTGVVLGLAYNWFGLQSERGWGLSWIRQDRIVDLPAVGVDAPVAAADPYETDRTDPFALDERPGAALPEIPALGRPVQIDLEVLKRYVDADGALIVDAREPDEYRAGAIPGAINLPYDEVVSDPARLERLDTGGRPIVTYCGGGSCELSIDLAEELIFAGHPRVAVYIGGFPEWATAGYPVERPRSDPQ